MNSDYGSGEYASDYHRMVVTGLVDHEWSARVQKAATHVSDENLADVLAEKGFVHNDDLESALHNLDWSSIRAVAQAFDPENPLKIQLIC